MVAPSLQVEQYQYKDNGVLLNGDVAMPFFDITNVQGLDSAPFRVTTGPREGQDGGYVDAEFEDIRTVILEGTIYASTFNLETYLDSLKANFAPTSVNNPLYFQTDAGPRMVFGKSLGIRFDKSQARRTGRVDAQIQVQCEDPTIYTPTVVTASTTLATGSTTGRGYNKSYAFSYGGAATQNGLVFTLGGNKPSAGKLRITGPVVNPQIINDDTGSTMTFQITMSATDYLDIDLATKAVTLNGTANRRSLMTLTGGWFTFRPGTNNLRFLGTQSPPTPLAVLTATAYSAWR